MKKALLVLFCLFLTVPSLATKMQSYSAWHSVGTPSVSISSGSTIAGNASFSDHSLVPKLQSDILVFWDANRVEQEINVGNCPAIPNGGSAGPTYNARNVVVAEQPLLESDPAKYNEWPFCRFDGVDDRLFTSLLAPAITQPFYVCFVAQGSIGAGTTGPWFDRVAGATMNGGLRVGSWFASAGANMGGGSVSPTSVYAACYRYNGLLSDITVTGAVQVAGNVGTNGMQGTTIFSRTGGGANMRAVLPVMAVYDDTGADVNTDWLDFVTARYGAMNIPP
jgi:hypothetical protein